MSDSGRTVTLTELVRIPLRRWPTVMAGMLLVAGLVLGYLSMVAPTYTATTEVALRLPVTNPFGYPGTGADRVINMNVETSLATGPQVIGALSEAAGQPAAEVRRALSVEAPVGGQQLRFRYASASAGQARLGADTAAQAYLALRRDMYAEQRDGRLAGYDERIAEIGDELAAIEERLDDLPVGAAGQSPAAAAALAELSGLQTELGQLHESRTEIQAVDITPGWVTRPAERNPPSTHDRGRLLLLAGLAGGGLLGAVAAFGLESAGRRVRTADDAVQTTGAPLLGTVRRRRRWVPAAVVDADTRYAALALASRLRSRGELPNSAPAPFVLISPRPDPARTALVSGLAVELAVTGGEVYVVSPSHRTDRLRSAVLSVRSRLVAPGAPVVPPPERAASAGAEGRRPGGAGRLALVDARPVVELEPLAGAIPVGSGTVRIGPTAPDAGAAVVLVDAPAAELSPDGVRCARDGLAVVVAARDRTRVAELRRLVERLRGVGVTPIGVIVTGS